jgi:hypothetical protein
VLVAMLGLEPNTPAGMVGLSPNLPPEWGAVRMVDVPLGETSLSIEVDRDGECSASATGNGLRIAGTALADSA